MTTSANSSLDATTNSLARLRRLNRITASVLALQAVAILFFSNNFSIPVIAAFQEGPPGTVLSKPVVLFDMPYGPLIFLFLFLAAVDHALVASSKLVGWYEKNLRAGINYARWIEYSISASIMILLIAMLTGINNFYALLGLFAINATMILFGLLMERINQGRSRVDWLPFVFGCIAGIIPWVAITFAIVGSQKEGGGVPIFVYVIFITLFILFNCFAINQWLQYRGKGKWADYLYGERVYLILSLVAKSALAWQVFGGTLSG